ncbi:MAG: hypothetical protein KKG95_08145 [Candidatus Omnitrophica bacterium]|nr:hypothetical protein [Candidatus Omnitrophota bacterium]
MAKTQLLKIAAGKLTNHNESTDSVRVAGVWIGDDQFSTEVLRCAGESLFSRSIGDESVTVLLSFMDRSAGAAAGKQIACVAAAPKEHADDQTGSMIAAFAAAQVDDADVGDADLAAFVVDGGLGYDIGLHVGDDLPIHLGNDPVGDALIYWVSTEDTLKVKGATVELNATDVTITGDTHLGDDQYHYLGADDDAYLKWDTTTTPASPCVEFKATTAPAAAENSAISVEAALEDVNYTTVMSVNMDRQAHGGDPLTGTNVVATLSVGCEQQDGDEDGTGLAAIVITPPSTHGGALSSMSGIVVFDGYDFGLSMSSNRINWAASSVPQALGEVGMDTTTGRLQMYVGGSARNVAHTDDLGGEWTDGGAFIYPADGASEDVVIGATTQMGSERLRVSGDVFIDKDDTPLTMTLATYDNSATQSKLQFYASRGTIASKVAVAANDDVGRTVYSGWNGSAHIDSAYCFVKALDTFGAGARSQFEWWTAGATGSPGVRMRLNNDTLYVAGQMYFPGASEDKLSFYEDRLDASNGFCIGYESNCVYVKSAVHHRWYINTNADGGASDYMELNSSRLDLNVDMRFNAGVSTPTISVENGTGTRPNLAIQASSSTTTIGAGLDLKAGDGVTATGSITCYSGDDECLPKHAQHIYQFMTDIEATTTSYTTQGSYLPIDVSDSAPGKRTFRWEVVIKAVDAGSVVYAQLYNLTDNAYIAGSEVSINGAVSTNYEYLTADVDLTVGGTVTGRKLYGARFYHTGNGGFASTAMVHVIYS